MGLKERMSDAHSSLMFPTKEEAEAVLAKRVAKHPTLWTNCYIKPYVSKQTGERFFVICDPE